MIGQKGAEAAQGVPQTVSDCRRYKGKQIAASPAILPLIDTAEQITCEQAI